MVNAKRHMIILMLMSWLSAHGHGRSVTALAGKPVRRCVIYLLTVNNVAYDGQSGSKDRGDPQVYFQNFQDAFWINVPFNRHQTYL